MEVFDDQLLNQQDFSVSVQRALTGGGVVLPYSGWLGHDNVGDEIVFGLLCHLLQRALDANRAPLFRDVKLPHLLEEFDWSPIKAAVLGGGSTIDKFYIRPIVPALEAGLPIFCFAAGFQNDFDLIEDERRMIGLLSGARFGSVRGTATKQVLEQIAGPSPLEVIVDGGFLAPLFYPPAPPPPGPLPRMAINLLDLEYARAPVLELMAAYKHAFEFVLLPFDPPTLAGLAELRAAAPADCRVHLETDFTNYTTLLSWYAASDLSLNMKLHASVLSSAVGTPPLGWGGGRKMDEYFSSIGSDAFRIRSFEVDELQQAVERVKHQKPNYAISMQALLGKTFQAHLSTVESFLHGAGLTSALAAPGGAVQVTGIRAIDCGFILLTRAG